jgi:hypothetical protein
MLGLREVSLADGGKLTIRPAYASIKNDVQTPLSAPHGGSAFNLPYRPYPHLPI